MKLIVSTVLQECAQMIRSNETDSSTVLQECAQMIHSNETDSKYSVTGMCSNDTQQ